MAKAAAARVETAPDGSEKVAANDTTGGIGHNSKANPHEMTWTDPKTGQVWSRGIQMGSENVLDFPAHLVPEGFTYQWVRQSIINQPDQANIVSRGRNGWRPVPQDRHPDRIVEYEGLRLYEAPTVFVEAARKEERARALREKITALPGMQLPSGFDGNHAGARANTFARVGTPEPASTAQPTYQRQVDIDS